MPKKRKVLTSMELPGDLIRRKNRLRIHGKAVTYPQILERGIQALEDDQRKAA